MEAEQAEKIIEALEEFIERKFNQIERERVNNDWAGSKELDCARDILANTLMRQL